MLIVAAILGDTVNYAVGKYLGSHVARYIKKDYFLTEPTPFLKSTAVKPITTAVRSDCPTFAPFVAGIGAMAYSKFILYNVGGGIAWVVICVLAGYFFGNMKIVKDNFELVIRDYRNLGDAGGD